MLIGKRQSQKRRKSLKTRLLQFLAAVFVLALVIEFLNWRTEGEGSWQPDYQKADLAGIVSRDTPGLSEDDYHTLFIQTGLGKPAVDELFGDYFGSERLAVFRRYQDNFFASGDYECDNVAIIVYDERIRDEEGNLAQGFEIPDLENGDIFLTKATHSLGWRHGHAAIVTDAAKGETLEAILLGTPARLQNASKWRSYPSFIHLRLKGADAALRNEIAQYAKETMLGLPYGIFTGIPEKAPEEAAKTQCSHLVWYPFRHFGYDLDSDGYWLVTPKDIANSDLLEVVQVYGVDPEALWPDNLPF